MKLKVVLILAALFGLLFISNCSWATKDSSPFIVVLSPHKGVVWEEGRTYKIAWKSRGVKKICIDVLMGGHDAGMLNDCNIDASTGHYFWSIPKGFVSGFGIRKNSSVKVYVCNKSESLCASSGYFTIVQSLPHRPKINPIRIKPKPIE